MEQTNSDQFSVLIVDDDPSYRSVLRTIYARANYAVSTAEDGIQASNLLERGHFDLVITDLQMPNMDGLDLVRIMQSSYPHTPIIIMGANPDDERYASLLHDVDVHCLSKPFRRSEVLELSHSLLNLRDGSLIKFSRM